MGKSVDLSYVSWDAWTDEGVCREGYCTCLPLGVHMERIGPETVKVSWLSLPVLSKVDFVSSLSWIECHLSFKKIITV